MSYRSFRPLTVGILGLGDIGQSIGLLLKTAGFRVAGFKRRVDPEEVKKLRASADEVTDDLDAVLSQSDFVVSVLPSTPATRYLLTEDRLAATCREKKPVFINVGRGDVISEATIVSALDNQILSKVVLDVFETEPLPKESKLWTHPNVLLTPHVSALSLPEDIADVFVRNLDLHLAQEPLQFSVDWTRGY
jgi:phosphoglycerate dehydrogenase-like enzyme